MNFDILEVFTRAAKITWKYKVLWIFGILASCGRSSGGNGGNSNSSSSGNGENPFSPQMMNQLESFILQIGNWFEQNTWVIFALIVFVLIVFALQIFFYYVGTAGLVRGVVHAENGAETIRFGELFSESLKYFWRLFGAALIIFLPFVIFFVALIIILAVSAGSSNESMIGGVLILLIVALCCCLFPVGIFLNLYFVQVIRAIAVEELGVFASLSRGWQVLTKNILGLILVGIIIFIGSAILGILISLPAILIVVPLMFTLMDGNITSWQPFILAGVFLLCYSPIAWFLNGVLITYTESVWTLVYLRVTQPKEENMPIAAEANA